MTNQNLRILKYYKEGNSLSGFEGVHRSLYEAGYLNDDLELTPKGLKFIKEFKDWKSIKI